MRRLHPGPVAFFLLGISASAALGQEHVHPGNARAGRDFVGFNCDACHVVAGDQEIRPLISGYAPSFAEVANRPGTTPETLRDFLSHAHAYSNMPYPDLTAADLANVVAYIMSLRHRHEGQEMR